MVIERSTTISQHTIERIASADTIIWDECGMSSKRIFQLVNAIHHALASQDDKTKPFGGKMLVLSIHINVKIKVLVPELFIGVVTHYLRMGSCQFLKDFRRTYDLKKTAEHRKKVLQRQGVAAVQKAHVPFLEIVGDMSPGKRNSHNKLFAFISNYKAEGLAKVNVKPKLVSLCKAYGINVLCRDNKKKLSDALANVVLAANDSIIPQAWIINNQQPVNSRTEMIGERIVLRIALSGNVQS
ncbi:hypothetical protein QZH41_015847 [Actinostola sp. cb2023]|nr:hypothetical protein QZH41_015847 [Actinostola sp. cb2023]